MDLERIRNRAFDIDMPDLQKCGGLGKANGLLIYQSYYVPFAPHMVASYIGGNGMYNFMYVPPVSNSLLWNGKIFTKDPMWREIVRFEGDFLIKDSYQLSNKPGLGVDINAEALKKYAQPGVPFFE